METKRQERLNRLYESRDLADLEIACGPKIFRIHATVVRAGPSYFTTAFFGGVNQARRTTRVDLSEDPFLVARMIRVLYGLDYPDNQIPGRADGNVDVDDGESRIMASSDENATEESWISRANTNVKMYILGDEYELPGLKRLAHTKVESALDTAHQHLDSPLGLTLESELLAEIPLLYDWTLNIDRAMRDLLLAHVSAHWSRLATADSLLSAIADAPRFAVEMVAAASPGAMYIGACRRCGTRDRWTTIRVRCHCMNADTVPGAERC